MTSLDGRRILLGVAGGIAAYKAAALVRRLGQAGAEVRVVLTANAARFVAATTFQALSGQPVRSDLWDAQAEAAMGHIELARWADLLLVAPATANVIARAAHGLADDLLTTLLLASPAPLVMAPAMNQAMWAHPATQANLEALRARGVVLLGPGVGDQACGDVGSGRMLEPDEIVAGLAALAAPAAADPLLAGRRVLVSAGPTREDIDPVRYIGNRSSGRMGFAIAQAAREMGADVVLVAGPCHLPAPPGVTRIDVRSAQQMHDAVLGRAAWAQVYVGAAAVSDYRPARVAGDKISKMPGEETLVLERTPDILVALSRRSPRPFLVGFAAETRDLEAAARRKLAAKDLDMIAANQVGGELGFASVDNELVVFTRGGDRIVLERNDKQVLARQLLREVAARLPPVAATAGTETAQ